jgi:hypothetical protein
MAFSSTSSNGVHHATDEAIDSLYSWMPPSAPAPSLPEAAFSLTLKGTLDGIEALCTIRGQSAAEFQRNLAAVRGLLDAPAPPAPKPPQPQGTSWCAIHDVAMPQTTKEGRSWYSHRLDDGTWCKGKGK